MDEIGLLCPYPEIPMYLVTLCCPVQWLPDSKSEYDIKIKISTRPYVGLSSFPDLDSRYSVSPSHGSSVVQGWFESVSDYLSVCVYVSILFILFIVFSWPLEYLHKCFSRIAFLWKISYSASFDTYSNKPSRKGIQYEIFPGRGWITQFGAGVTTTTDCCHHFPTHTGHNILTL